MLPYRALGAMLGWFAVLVQYWLSTSEHGFVDGSISYFGFFTLWGNILVAAAFVAPFLPAGAVSGFFLRPGVRTAVAVYILVVAVVFYLLLRKLFQPVGLGAFINVLLHYVMPALYLADWAMFVPKRGLRFGQIPAWLIFPLLYAAATLGLGAHSGYYPYPFLNAGEYGYRRIGVNVAALTMFFVVVSVGFVAVGQRLSAKKAWS